MGTTTNPKVNPNWGYQTVSGVIDPDDMKVVADFQKRRCSWFFPALERHNIALDIGALSHLLTERNHLLHDIPSWGLGLGWHPDEAAYNHPAFHFDDLRRELIDAGLRDDYGVNVKIPQRRGIRQIDKLTHKSSQARRKRQEAVIAAIRRGLTVKDACHEVGVTPTTYRNWRNNVHTDSEWFRSQVDVARRNLAHARSTSPPTDLSDVEEFRLYYFGYETFRHHRLIADALEDTPPDSYTLILMPPEAGKTTFLTDWTSQRLALRPTDRILVMNEVAEASGTGGKMLAEVKLRMTDPNYSNPWAPQHRIPEYISTFGPFHDPTEDRGKPWNSRFIKISQAGGGGGGYSLQVVSANSTNVYGTRAEILIGDDIQSISSYGTENTGPRNSRKLLEYLRSNFFTRITADTALPSEQPGRAVFIGTRVGKGDIYEQMIESGIVDQLIMVPALMDPENWGKRADVPPVPLEIKTTDDAFDAWVAEHWHPHVQSFCPQTHPLERLARIRRRVGEQVWYRNYQQAPEQAEPASFSAELIDLVKVPKPARTVPGGYIPIMMLDPALGGGNAIMVAAYTDSKFRPIDCETRSDMRSNEDIFERLAHFMGLYRPTELVIETNAQQKSVARDSRLRDLAARSGCRITEHHTNLNKVSVTFGVGAIPGAFQRGEIEIPYQGEAEQRLWLDFIEQLKSWRPNSDPKLVTQDLVMAFWFGWARWEELRQSMRTPSDGWNFDGTPWNVHSPVRNAWESFTPVRKHLDDTGYRVA